MTTKQVPVQGAFDDLGTPLHGVTFVVVDLETTGGSPVSSAITEIGAVKVRGGERLGEFQSLVDPGIPIPAFISVLTGITDGMVAQAPPIEAVLPAFLEFSRDAVLVAHNARFDVTFLRTAAHRLGLEWHEPAVLDTVHLARQLVTRDETPNHKLGSLARLFGAETTPDHRALHDARATVDVLHGLLGRVGNLGVHSLEELTSYSARVPAATRRKRVLADGLPSAPGVYVFKDDAGRPLYVGTSVDIRRRVLNYFTAGESRRRMREMVGLATSVTPIVCPTALEAQVREMRLIAEHKPRYNRRGRSPDRAVWLKLTTEAFPRLSVVRQMRADGAQYVGPFPGRRQAESAMAAVHEVLPLRQCTQRISLKGNGSSCALAELGRCGAPCVGSQTRTEYEDIAEQARQALVGNAEPVVAATQARMAVLAEGERYEDAGQVRDRMLALVRAAARAQRLAPLLASPEIVAARRSEAGGWEFVCVRHGRLAGTAACRRGEDPLGCVAALRASAETVLTPADGSPCAYPQESELVLRWLESDGVRLVHVDGTWTCPVDGAGRARSRLEPLVASWEELDPFEEAGSAGAASRPARTTDTRVTVPE